MSVADAAASRASAFGLLGQYLLGIINSDDKGLAVWPLGASTTEQITLLHRLATAPGASLSPFTAAGLSLLAADFPVQVPLGYTALRTLVLHSFDFSFFPTLGEPATFDVRGKPLCQIDDTGAFLLSRPRVMDDLFPVKRHPAATLKCNVKLREVLFDLRGRDQLQSYSRLLASLAGKCTNDQAAAAVIYCAGIRPTLGAKSQQVAAAMLLQPDNAKGLSNAFKGLGANSDLFGACFVEGQTLQGRGVGTIDLDEEARYRCDPDKVESHVVDVDQEALRRVVVKILQEELEGRELTFKPLDEFWDHRWQWCVNGAHSRVLDRNYGPDTAACYPGVDRVYRRMYAEALQHEPISDWDGTVYVSGSAKLEHGKTRAIFACDSRSYFAFEHFLGPVSGAWRDKKVLLDPGSSGHLGLAGRVLKAWSEGGVNVMLDYDDFNSQHSTASMQTLIRATGEFVGYPPELLDTLVASFEKEEIYVRGKLIGRAVGTLMSGHRGTTYINSVLNAAYIRLAYGEEDYSRAAAFHVGDDVYMSVPTFADAGNLLNRAVQFGCRMNPTKQSVGVVGAEFLRMGIRRTHSVGYFARGVASAVSGSWVDVKTMSPYETAVSAVTSGRTLANRSRCHEPALLLARSMSSRTRLPLKVCRDLLVGRASFVGAPVYARTGVIFNYRWIPEAVESRAKLVPDVWPRYATTSYLANSLTPLERTALHRIGGSVMSAMLLASFNRAVASDLDATPSFRVVREAVRQAVGSTAAQSLVTQTTFRGVLSKFPILTLLRSHLPRDVLRELVALAGGNSRAVDLDREAWGGTANSVVVDGVMSYSDASMLGARTVAGVLYSTYPVYM